MCMNEVGRICLNFLFKQSQVSEITPEALAFYKKTLIGNRRLQPADSFYLVVNKCLVNFEIKTRGITAAYNQYFHRQDFVSFL